MVTLDDEQQMLVRTLRDFAENEFSDKAFSWEGEFPWEHLEALAEQDFLGINLPVEYGGGGMGELEAILAIETVGQIDPDTANALYFLSMVSPRAIDMFGTEAAKEKYLPPVCDGESAIGIAISEPHAGSDAGAMTTTLTEEDGEYYLNGEKIWVSFMPESDAVVVWARLEDGGMGNVIIDLDAAGIDVNEHYENMVGHTQTHFFMDDIHVPKENVLVASKEGMKEQLKTLNWERCGSAAFANAIARCALDKALDYAKEREQFDQPIGEFQGMRWKFADMVTELQASRTLVYETAINAEQRGRVPDRLDTSIAKLYSGQMVEDVVSESLQVFGATGYQREHPLEYLYRLQRSRRIAAGTDEIMKNTIADQVFQQGLPELV
jgi:alkylation response protein AidB-like acyl-CoA dehydrogenase